MIIRLPNGVKIPLPHPQKNSNAASSKVKKASLQKLESISQKGTYFDFPEGILLEIFKYLDKKQLVACGQVNQLWQKVSKNEKFWEKIYHAEVTESLLANDVSEKTSSEVYQFEINENQAFGKTFFQKYRDIQVFKYSLYKEKIPKARAYPIEDGELFLIQGDLMITANNDFIHIWDYSSHQKLHQIRHNQYKPFEITLYKNQLLAWRPHPDSSPHSSLVYIWDLNEAWVSHCQFDGVTTQIAFLNSTTLLAHNLDGILFIDVKSAAIVKKFNPLQSRDVYFYCLNESTLICHDEKNILELSLQTDNVEKIEAKLKIDSFRFLKFYKSFIFTLCYKDRTDRHLPREENYYIEIQMRDHITGKLINSYKFDPGFVVHYMYFYGNLLFALITESKTKKTSVVTFEFGISTPIREIGRITNFGERICIDFYGSTLVYSSHGHVIKVEY